MIRRRRLCRLWDPLRISLVRLVVTLPHTNERTHEILRSGLDRSPMYTGVIDGVGRVIVHR